MANEVKFTVTADTTQATTEIKKFETTATKSSKKMESSFAETEKSIGSGFGDIAKFAGKDMAGGIETAITALGKMKGPLMAIASMALVAFETFKAVKFAEEVNQLNNQFDILSKNAGVAGDAIKRDLIQSANGMIETDDITRALNKSMVELGSNANNLGPVFDLARKVGLAFGKDTLTVFEDMSSAIANGNTKLLKQYGIVIDSGKVLKDYAASLNVGTDSLTDFARQQAIMGAIVDKGSTQLAGIETASSHFMEASHRLVVSIKEIGQITVQAIGNQASPIMTSFLQVLDNVALQVKNNLASSFSEGVEKSVADLALLQAKMTSLRQEQEFFQGKKDAGVFMPVNGEAPTVALTRIQKAMASTRGEIELLMESQRKLGTATRQQTVLEKQLVEKSQQQIQAEMQKKQQFDQMLLQAEMASADARIRTATTNEQLQTAINDKKLFVETEFNNKLAAAHKDYLDKKIINQQEFDAYEKALREKRNADMQDLEKKQNAVMEEMGKAAKMGLQNGLVAGFTALGAALAKGKNGFEAFGKAVLSSLGAMAIQIGTLLLSIGLGFSALGPVLPPFGLSGGAAIAAGLGLIALGGALQAMGGGGGESGGATAGGGVATGGGGGSVDVGGATGLQEVPEAKPQTKVDVIVQGNILDRRQSGLEIAEIINEAFGSNGVVIASAS